MIDGDPSDDPGEVMPRGLHRHRTARGAVTIVGAQLVHQITTLSVQLLLTRLLAPSDFGLLGIVLVFTGLGTVLAQFGLAPAVVQRPRVTDSYMATALWLSVAASSVVATALSAAAPALAQWVEQPRLRDLVVAVAWTLPVASAAGVLRARIVRDLMFGGVVAVDVASSVVSGGLAIVLAASGAGVWSLVAQAWTNHVIVLVGLFATAPWRPRPRIDVAAAKDLLRFGSEVVGYEGTNFLARNVDNLIIGRLLGPVALGHYARAYELMLVPVRQLAWMLGRVMFPSLARAQSSPGDVTRLYLTAVRIIALLAMPAMALLTATAPDVVPLVFGPAWTPMVPIVQILAPVGALHSIVSTVGWIYQSTGRTDLLLRWGLRASAVMVTGIVLGAVTKTVTGVAAGYAIAAGPVLLYPAFQRAGALVGFTFADVARAVWRIVVAAIAAGTAALGFRLVVSPSDAPLAVAGAMACGGLTYATLLAALREPTVRDLPRMLRLARSGQPPTAV